MSDSTPRHHGLVFAMAHEIANHLGAIRLQAHLLDEDLDLRALAGASIEIDGLAGRAGPLLALLRPLLTRPEPIDASAASSPSWVTLLAGLSREVEDEGTRGVRVEFDVSPEPERTAPSVDWLHPLLMALVTTTIDSISRQGSLRLGLEPGASETALVLEDDGGEEDLSAEAALRGRPLVVSIARSLLAGLGGRVEVGRVDEKTRVGLIFPNES